MSPKIAVAESPSLAATLKLIGLSLITDNTEAAQVAAAIRSANPGRTELIVITPAHTSTLKAWAQSLVADGRLVAILGGDGSIAKAAHVHLPCTINELLAIFHAPPSAEYGDRVIGADFVVSEDDDNEEPWDLLEGAWGTGSDGDTELFDSDLEPVSPSSPPAPEVPRPATPTVTPTIPQMPTPAAAQPQPAFSQPQPSPDTTWAAVETGPGPSPEPVDRVDQHDADHYGQIRPQAPQPVGAPVAPSVPLMSPLRSRPNAPLPLADALEQPAHRYVESPDAPDLHYRSAPMVSFAPLKGDPASPAPGAFQDEPTRLDSSLAPVIVVFAVKGGVGKSNFAVTLAQAAVEGGVQRVILVDGNRGQGDVATYLRLTKPLPSIYDAAVQDDPRGAIIPPKTLNAARDPRLPAVGFGMVMAPRTGQVDSTVVTSSMYGDVVDEARDFADLVIIDTQISEEEDTSGLWDEVWLPLLRSGGWGVGIGSDSHPAMLNLQARLASWGSAGIPTDQILVALNDISSETLLDIDQIVESWSRHFSVMGVVPHSDEVRRAFQVGRIPLDVPEISRVMNAILLRVTGRHSFAVEPAEPRPAGFLASLFGRGRR